MFIERELDRIHKKLYTGNKIPKPEMPSREKLDEMLQFQLLR